MTTDLTARTQPAKPDCSRAPSLTDRITEILRSPVEGSGGTPLYLGVNGHRLGDKGFAHIHYAALIAAVAEEHYRPRVETVAERDALPVGTVIRSNVGTIAARFDRYRGVVFGDDRPIEWTCLALPAVVLWSPGAGE